MLVAFQSLNTHDTKAEHASGEVCMHVFELRIMLFYTLSLLSVYRHMGGEVLFLVFEFHTTRCGAAR